MSTTAQAATTEASTAEVSVTGVLRALTDFDKATRGPVGQYMTETSDRIALPEVAALVDGLDTTRARTALLLAGLIHPVTKYAPHGAPALEAAMAGFDIAARHLEDVLCAVTAATPRAVDATDRTAGS